MTIKSRYILIISFALLAACGQTPPATETPTITVPPSTEMMTPLPTFTPPPVAFAFSTATATFAPKPIPVSTSTETFPLDNLRMAYIVDENLYVQNGSNPPKKLSDSGKDWSPMFSDDGEKIVFYRGKALEYHNSIFSVNADGSQMQEIITTAWLDALSAGTKAGQLAFVPNTHQTLFNTYQCPQSPKDISLGCTVGLFLADTDTGKIKVIMPPTLGSHLPWDGESPWRGNFSISTDGNLLSVAHDGQIDILDMNGEIVRRAIINYTRSAPIEFYPRVYWLSNSKDLIIALPTETKYYMGTPPKYAVWRYALDKNIATQIPLDPSPIWIYMECNDLLNISPNGDWVVYFADNYDVYRGSLIDGKTRIYLTYQCSSALWSSDSAHFIYGENSSGFALGSVNEPPSFVSGLFLGWIDAKRYIYSPIYSFPIKENVQIRVGEIRGEAILTYQSNISVLAIDHPNYFTFTWISNK